MNKLNKNAYVFNDIRLTPSSTYRDSDGIIRSMDELIPDIQMIVYKYVHKMFMYEIIEELPRYLYNYEEKKCEILKEYLISVLGKNGRYKKFKYVNEKIANEIVIQRMIDKGDSYARLL